MNTAQINISGHVFITDNKTKEVLLDKKNAVHSKNLAVAIARGLANQSADSSGVRTNQIYKIKLGNGGTSSDALGVISFNPPNVSQSSAKLYSETYSEIIDDAASGVSVENSVVWINDPTPDSTSAIVVCTAIIGADEPAGQLASDADANSNINNLYSFDELGLFTSDDLLLSHIIFAPILKTLNRELAITYTLTITIS